MKLLKIKMLLNGVFLDLNLKWNSGADWLNFTKKWGDFAKKRGYRPPIFFIENQREVGFEF